MYKALRDELANVLAELQRIAALIDEHDELLHFIELRTVTLHGLKGDDTYN